MSSMQAHPDEAAETNDDQELHYKHIPDMVSAMPSSKGAFGIPLYRHAQGWHASRVSMVGAMVADACFTARPTDIVVATLPKSGTTWIKSLLYATVHRGEHPAAADGHPFSSSGPHECVRFLESQVYAHDRVPDLGGLPDPRLFATHVPFAALPGSVVAPTAGCRVVYVCRDPKDALVSLWAFQNKLRARHGRGQPVDVEDAAELFCDGVSPFGPYWDHVLGYWRAHLDRPDRVLFFRYEEMRRDPAAHVRRLAEFVGLPFGAGSDDDEVDAVVRLCSFERMAKLDVTRAGKTEFVGGTVLDNSSFFRRGVVGDWANHLSMETARRIDAITDARFKGSGLALTM